ncbi:hypothetical protein [Duganella vulcania]|uniref:Uncharacterized protein n=1 Tax=Duganella vulcania TaxID=2692166 RepID=A0A845GGS7_9BURK|nr:hypothetical protein [Duganella vulcania]MYM92466.1 hypothetical protein [Duganella vulcania]
MMIDTAAYFAKLAAGEAISESEVQALLNELQSSRTTAAYLADCHAATLESMPKSASKSSRVRQRTICEIAARALRGDRSAVRFPVSVEAAAARCEQAAHDSHSVKKEIP